MELDPSAVLNALRKVNDPELHRSLVDLNMIRELKITPAGQVSFTLALTIPSCPMRSQMADEARQAVKALPGVSGVEITFGVMTAEERRALLGRAEPALPKLAQFNRIGQIIAVMSGKGGVGKSSITALLACALARQGQKVGILDADITGPSIPRLFGLPTGGLRGSEQGMLPAITAAGVRVVSANLMLQAEDTAVIWRGPMISGLIKQFWTDVIWGKLDTLLVDLPPGTSDPALTVTHNLPLTGAVLVTTPQDLAAMVVRKAVHMLEQVNVPVLAVVENMAYFRCPDCGQAHELFGAGHLDELKTMANAPLGVRLPINPEITRLADSGQIETAKLEEMEQFAAALSALPVSRPQAAPPHLPAV